jgi:hypothetical protein
MRTDKNIYQTVAVIGFFLFLVMGWKYNELSKAYAKAEADKVHYCKEYHALVCEIENK